MRTSEGRSGRGPQDGEPGNAVPKPQDMGWMHECQICRGLLMGCAASVVIWMVMIVGVYVLL